MFKILNDIKTSLKNHPWGWKEHLPYLLMLTLSLVALILGVLVRDSMITRFYKLLPPLRRS